MMTMTTMTMTFVESLSRIGQSMLGRRYARTIIYLNSAIGRFALNVMLSSACITKRSLPWKRRRRKKEKEENEEEEEEDEDEEDEDEEDEEDGEDEENEEEAAAMTAFAGMSCTKGSKAESPLR
uniref:Uncharacterized protein n=1 Tax=Vespula pensylvanica TaxID=30213 RepID=A0A834U7G8_VESPE|nr:hypothetical protein H0235_010167 [Vespula pensylvanica]